MSAPRLTAMEPHPPRPESASAGAEPSAGEAAEGQSRAAAPTTLAALFEAEEGRLLHFAIGLVGRRAVAEELVQEAFMRLHPLWGTIENPRAWLYRCLRNLSLNHLRDHRRETDLDETAERPHDAPHTGEDLGRMEAIGLVRMLLAELPEADRDLIRLKYHENLKYHEISRRTGIGTGTVGYKLHHLLKGLAEALRHAGVEGSRG